MTNFTPFPAPNFEYSFKSKRSSAFEVVRSKSVTTRICCILIVIHIVSMCAAILQLLWSSEIDDTVTWIFFWCYFWWYDVFIFELFDFCNLICFYRASPRTRGGFRCTCYSKARVRRIGEKKFVLMIKKKKKSRMHNLLLGLSIYTHSKLLPLYRGYV